MKHRLIKLMSAILAAALLRQEAAWALSCALRPVASDESTPSRQLPDPSSKLAGYKFVHWQGLPPEQLAERSLPYLLKALGVESKAWPPRIEITEENIGQVKSMFADNDIFIGEVCETLFDAGGKPLALYMNKRRDEIRAVHLKPVAY
ncbi:MAG: hypothetical protein ABH825_01315, partial [Candidatus Omnitrophota bacterium]